MASDPGANVHRDLLPHVHLLSTYRFPAAAQMHHDKVLQYLLNAPKIARDQAAFYWTYLDRPADGTIHLVYQSGLLGAECPSDGYIWAPPETTFQMEVPGGYLLEMHHCKSGFVQGEHFAMHSRRRYRLLPSRTTQPQQGMPMPEPNLWIIHYSQAADQDRIPTSVMAMDRRIEVMLNARAYLRSQGQIVQKEFMLFDKANWPVIAFPRSQRPGSYGGNMQPARMPQTMAYPTQEMMTGPPPQKRARTDETGHGAAPPGAHPMLGDDDDEDTSRGDYWDMVQPREISEFRYIQNHMWMEEVVSSQYPIHRIVPTDLGLGMRGDLGRLTETIFDAPFSPQGDSAKALHKYTGRLDKDKADLFRKRVEKHAEDSNKEMERMKAQHAKRLVKFKSGVLVNLAEEQLRNAVDDPTDVGSEFWRIEGRLETDDQGDEQPQTQLAPKVADILAQVEASLGRHAAAVQQLERIHDGGYEENIKVPTPQLSPKPSMSEMQMNGNGDVPEGEDVEMGGSQSGLLDHFNAAIGSQSTLGQTPSNMLTGLSAANTPLSANMPSPQRMPVVNAPGSIMAPAQGHPALSNQQGAPPPSATGSSISVAGSDWVVIPPGGVSPNPSNPPPPPSAAMTGLPAGVDSASPAMLATGAQGQSHVGVASGSETKPIDHAASQPSQAADSQAQQSGSGTVPSSSNVQASQIQQPPASANTGEPQPNNNGPSAPTTNDMDLGLDDSTTAPTATTADDLVMHDDMDVLADIGDDLAGGDMVGGDMGGDMGDLMADDDDDNGAFGQAFAGTQGGGLAEAAGGNGGVGGVESTGPPTAAALGGNDARGGDDGGVVRGDGAGAMDSEAGAGAASGASGPAS